MPVSLHYRIKVDTIQVLKYINNDNEENKNIKTIVLRMNYGDSRIINAESAQVLNEVGCNVISVEVVFTNFHGEEVQKMLNKKRLTELYFLAPNIFSQSFTNWKYIEQTAYKSENGAKRLFHGIVVKYVQTAIYGPVSKESLFGDLKDKKLTDTSLYEILEKHIKFNQELVCIDLTGSMSPYYFQVFKWLLLKNSTKPLNFSFFNDGNNTPDNTKKMGKVGGVYLFHTHSIDTISNYAFKCISSGSGGDSPENDIEAILAGLKKYPSAKEVIIVVDNWSDMRDYVFLNKVMRPVKVIVCGTNSFGLKTAVNTQYLDLARATKGSIHTIEEDIENLAKLREGEIIKVAGARYLLKGGRFHKI